MSRTAASMLREALENVGVKYTFGIPGVHNTEIYDELAKSKLPPEEVVKLLKAGAFLVDVRPKIQAKMGMAPGATNISIFTLKRRLDELPRDRKILLYCHSGAAAGKAKQALDALGYKAFNGGGYKDIMKVVGR